ncbi:MAG: sulfurtransferase TusA family protein [Desulfobacterales bacterium]|jgi:TusA-related sulfurtransferase
MRHHTHSVDTSGYSCPINLAIVSRKLKSLDIGDLLEVVSDDPEFKKQIKTWSYETGNHLVDFKLEEDVYITRIRKGSGFKGETLAENIKFVTLGIKLHFIKALLRIIPLKKIQFLLTFVSVAEGLRAQGWLQEKEIKNYVPLPVPNHITRHCGLVFGFKNKKEAVRIFKLLDEAKFAVEDIYFEDEDKSYKVLNIT